MKITLITVITVFFLTLCFLIMSATSNEKRIICESESKKYVADERERFIDWFGKVNQEMENQLKSMEYNHFIECMEKK